MCFGWKLVRRTVDVYKSPVADANGASAPRIGLQGSTILFVNRIFRSYAAGCFCDDPRSDLGLQLEVFAEHALAGSRHGVRAHGCLVMEVKYTGWLGGAGDFWMFTIFVNSGF